MAVTLPLPPQVTKLFNKMVVKYLQWFAFYSFAALLVIPWLLCAYQITVKTLGRKKLIKATLNDQSAPKTVVVMPCYKERPDALLTAINSVVDCDYPASCIHVFLSFDGDEIDELYLTTADRLGIPVTLKEFPTSIDVIYNGARVTLSRFPHGGKRHCQKLTYRLINKVYEKYLQHKDDLFILFIDSDCILDRVCIQNFMYEMEVKPGRKHPILAMTGIITSTTESTSLITLLQDVEYVHGQLFERSVESGCGSVTCLPGALTILRFSAFRNMARFYFADNAENCEDLFDYGKCHLGEDRWLTHLFMVGAKHRYQIQLCTSAFCKTEAVQTVRSLLKQRRRWFLGFITNEVCLLTDWRLWKKYTVLCIVRFMQNTIRTTSLLFFIMVIAICTTSQKVQNLPVGFIAVSLGLNYLMMLYLGWKLKRFKAWLYPLMFLLNPFFNWVYMVYGIFSAGQRTWGGPRVEAEKDTTLAEQVSQHATADPERAEDKSSELPVFFTSPGKADHKDAVRHRKKQVRATLQPTSGVESAFEPRRLERASLQPGEEKRSGLGHVVISHPSVVAKAGENADWSDEDIEGEADMVHTPRRLTELLSESGMSPRMTLGRTYDRIDGADAGELSRRLSLLAANRSSSQLAQHHRHSMRMSTPQPPSGNLRVTTPATGTESNLTGTTAKARPSPLSSHVG